MNEHGRDACATDAPESLSSGRMWRWIVQQYARRIVNVNVNIVVAGFTAMVLAVFSVSLAQHLGVTSTSKLAIIYAVSDWFMDMVLATVLHWMANHWPRKWKTTGALVNQADRIAIDAGPPPLPFLKDATIIQMQRLCLSPLLYGSYFGMVHVFTHAMDFGPELATFTGMAVGVILCRVVHTFWMLADERRWKRKWEAECREKSRLAEASAPPGAPPLSAPTNGIVSAPASGPAELPIGPAGRG